MPHPPSRLPCGVLPKPTWDPEFSGHFRKDTASPSPGGSLPTSTPFLPAPTATFSPVNGGTWGPSDGSLMCSANTEDHLSLRRGLSVRIVVATQGTSSFVTEPKLSCQRATTSVSRGPTPRDTPGFSRHALLSPPASCPAPDTRVSENTPSSAPPRPKHAGAHV